MRPTERVSQPAWSALRLDGVRRLGVTGVLVLATAHAGFAQPGAGSLVHETLQHEMATRNEVEQLFYVSEETSTRTGGHAWKERVVELKGKTIRRLIAVDGVPLSAEKARAEDQRIAKLVAHPDASPKPPRDRQNGKDMASVMEHAFVYRYDGEAGGCTRLRFVPDPTFKPSGYEERILQALEGTVYIDVVEHRVCEINGRLSHTVEIGFGLLGKLEQGGRVHLVRARTKGGTWQVMALNLHLIGKILVLKDISQNDDEVRTDVRDLPADLSLAQAVELTRPQFDATP